MRFYPEGGKLCEGLLSRVAFKAVGSDGSHGSVLLNLMLTKFFVAAIIQRERLSIVPNEQPRRHQPTSKISKTTGHAKPTIATPCLKITPGTIVLLATAPLMWAGNGLFRQARVWPDPAHHELHSLDVGVHHSCCRLRDAANSDLWQHWRRYNLLGLLGVGSYNALQYAGCWC